MSRPHGAPRHSGIPGGDGTAGGRLTEDAYLCPSCLDGSHHCADLFVLPPFGVISCACEPCGRAMGVPS